ncbi:hypothetical protein CDAR_509961 [Caerostris darwini]|uniref:Uncharacterized protein n=1 Tax=Caerostris darwini TaxID=1538125 RepID=A0AAV4TW49_9ARAC|nr:hypothetical protein CDAR_509961 [Caerostris darwini]
MKMLRNKSELGIEVEGATLGKKDARLVKMTSTLEGLTVKFARNLFVWSAPSTFAQNSNVRKFNDYEETSHFKSNFGHKSAGRHNVAARCHGSGIQSVAYQSPFKFRSKSKRTFKESRIN